MSLKVSDFDYYLPAELIAQTPLEPRDRSRLMVLNRTTGYIEHRHFYEIVDYLSGGDILVFNDSRVIPARLTGRRAEEKVEIFLLRRLSDGIWETLAQPARKLGVGAKVDIIDEAASSDETKIGAEVLEQHDGGIKIIRFSDEGLLERLGRVPLPPYIRTPLNEPERYQTVYARVKGSVAAPTAGLHFTPELLKKLEQRGIQLAFITLHLGLDSFRPIQVEAPSHHPIHKEYGEVNQEVALLLSRAKRQGRRVIAVGTSTVRLVEAAAQAGGSIEVKPFAGWVSLFILPGYQFRVVDAMITNFHLPRSTLLMLVSAFAGRDFILSAYKEAKRLGYRFYSFGDAMFIV